MEADIQEDSDGRFYRDFYKVVIDDFSIASLLNDISSQQSPASTTTTSSSTSIPNVSSAPVPSVPYSISSPITSPSTPVSITNSTSSSSSSSTNQFTNNVSILMKKEFNRFHELVGFEIGNNSTTDSSSNTEGVNSTASEGNILEAINLALSRFESHNIDRDLNRTGQLITVISAGTGYFQITNSKLARITKHRMIEYGIGCDLICISRPPLHIVPLFLFKDKYLSSSTPTTSSVHSSTPSMTSTPNKGHSASTSNLFPSSSHSPISPEVFNLLIILSC